MDIFNLDLSILLAQLTNFIILGSWPLLSLIALLSLRRCKLQPVVQAMWVFIVLAIPILGAVAFWIINPSEEECGGSAQV